MSTKFMWETDGGATGYIEADSIEEARAIFQAEHPDIAPESAGVWEPDRKLSIRNAVTGEELALSRDVCTTHPAWVHEQCGTETESELQHMLDQYDMATMAMHAGQPDACGIYWPA